MRIPLKKNLLWVFFHPFHSTLFGQCFWGACGALGMPPTHWSWLFLLAFIMHRRSLISLPSWKKAFWQGWILHFSWMTLSLHWVVTALAIDWSGFWWLTPFACFGLPSFLALFGAIGAVISFFIKGTGLSSLWLVSLGYSLIEWGKGHLFTGFPWHLYGYALTSSSPLEQSVSLFGIYGLGFITILVALSLHSILFYPLKDSFKTLSFLVCLLGGLMGYGWIHLNQSPLSIPEKISIRVVQPHIPQTLKWDKKEAYAHLKTLVSLSKEEPKKKSFRTPSVVIWPETALPFILSSSSFFLPLVIDFQLPSPFLITGAIEVFSQDHQEPHYFNSLIFLNGEGFILSRYRKKHLLPFGEFVPFRQWIKIPSVAADRADYQPGEGPLTLSWPQGSPFSPLICYDVIFPGEVAHPYVRPHWLLNITNDAWFSDGWGPQQHFYLSRIRAIEEGVPLVRCANTGISALMDGNGRILHLLPFGTQGFFDAFLPSPLKTPLFAQYGHKATWFFIFCLGGLVFFLDFLVPPFKKRLGLKKKNA